MEQVIKELFTWVDAAYAVHKGMKSQTEETMSFGHETVHFR